MSKLKSKQNQIKYVHFGLIFFSLIIILFIYTEWPWRVWQLDYGIWRWFPSFGSLYEIAFWEAVNQTFGVLFLVPIVYTILFFKWQGSLNIILLTVAALSPIILGFLRGFEHYLIHTYLFLLPAVIAIIINLELDLRRRSKVFLIQRETDRRLYLSKVLEEGEKQRKRIAQEIHDDTIQTLLAIANYGEVIQSDESDLVEKQKSGALIRTSAIQTVENLRRLTLDLHPRLLDELGLIPALNWLVNTMNSKGDIHYELVIDGNERKLSSQIELIIFRTIQEALTNIKKHSKASKAIIQIVFSSEHITISVKDNGQGFFPDSLHNQLINGKMGIIGMRERIESLGGIFSIYSGPGEGTLISIKIMC